MSITITEIITVEEYIEAFPQDTNVEEDLIQSAINRATITLDAICGGMIAQVWGVTDPTSTLYRTDAEKNYIKQAHLIQAQYNVSRNLDMSAGTESYTSGSNNYNETRPRPDMVADEIIYQLLAQARVYNPNVTTDTTIKSVSGVADGFYDPSYDPLNEYVTYNVGDLRYVLVNQPNNANKYAKWDSNGNIIAEEIKVSPTGTSSAVVNFITIGGLEYQLGSGGGSSVWGGIQGTITDQTDLVEYITTRLNGYATEQWVLDKHYLTEHQSLAGYATQTWVNSQGFLKEHQSLADYYTKSQCDNRFLTEHQDISGKQDKITETNKLPYSLISGTPTIPTKTSELTNDSGFLTQHQSLANYYTKSETYSKSEVDTKIATGTGLYLGWLQNDDQQLPDENTIGTWIDAQPQSAWHPSYPTAFTNNDYVFIFFSTQYIYWRVKYVKPEGSETHTWKKDLEFDNDITAIKQQVDTNTGAINTINTTTIPNLTQRVSTIEGKEATWDTVTSKEDKINDLATIRSGASLGATAVQPSAISDMATKTWVGQQGYLTEHQSLDSCEKIANKSTTLDTTSDTKYPTCKAVYDYIQSLDGNDIDY